MTGGLAEQVEEGHGHLQGKGRVPVVVRLSPCVLSGHGVGAGRFPQGSVDMPALPT